MHGNQMEQFWEEERIVRELSCMEMKQKEPAVEKEK
jgi:hypothetical protein